MAYASTRDFLRENVPSTLERAVPAMLVSPQSFGDLLVAHPHAHAVVSLGLFSQGGVFSPMDDVDFSGLQEVFRERVFEMMIQRGKITPQIAEDMRLWPHSGFHLDWERRIEAEDRSGLEGLLSYMERAPVSLKRLTYRDDGMVHYQGTKLHPRLGTDHQLLPAVDFLALLVPHVLLRYEVTIRLYGAVSTSFRLKAGWIKDPPVKEPPPESPPPPGLPPGPEPPLTTPEHIPPPPQPPPSPPPPQVGPEDQDGDFLRARKRNWARLIQKVWLQDPTLCASCGQPMRIIAAISSPAQDDVIEKILRQLGRWDPPWKRLRKARGPPASRSTPSPSGPEVFDPGPDVDQYCADPLPDDS